jgi:hypothetical protein
VPAAELAHLERSVRLRQTLSQIRFEALRLERFAGPDVDRVLHSATFEEQVAKALRAL